MDNYKHPRKIFVLIIFICLSIFGVVIFHREMKIARNIVVLNSEKMTADDLYHNDTYNDCEYMDLFTTLQKPSIAASFGQGRTGSQLCFFAAGYALWRDFGILNFISQEQLDILKNTFVLPEQNELLKNSTYYTWRKGMLYFKLRHFT